MTAASLSAQLPRPGDMIAGKYLLDRLLGQGGMGAVFAAKHVKLSKAVAIKIMLADASNPEAAQRFINEGRAAANIQNEHVVRVDDVDEEMGYAYMVLELLDGEDLAQVLERDPARRLLPHVAVGYVLEALKGVAQAHAIGIVHRDLKPSNLFLARRKDGTLVVKVLDFGISKAQGSSALAASPSALTSTKAMLGSPLYMSPEQLRSSKSVDQRADIWAIGVILYELITGQLPFMGDNLGELFAAILETDPAPLRAHGADVSQALEEVVLRCLQRRPEHRFQTATELAAALAPFATQQAAAGGALGGTALLAPGAVSPVAGLAPSGSYPHAGAVTPTGPHMARPQLPSTGAVTGSGPRVIGGTIALGASTPQPGMQQTGDGWQSTGSAMGVPQSKAPLVIGLVAAVALALVGVGGALFAMKGRATSDPSTGSSVTASAPSAPIAVTPTAAPEVDPTPSATVAEPASAGSATAAVTGAETTGAAKTGAATTGGGATGAAATTKGLRPPTGPTTVKVDPPKDPDPKPPPQPTPQPKASATKPNGLQDNR
ncbi:MAG: protein kinase [Labilithrix sp.]|nr:protein kinase [Labilithrix sp.]